MSVVNKARDEKRLGQIVHGYAFGVQRGLWDLWPSMGGFLEYASQASQMGRSVSEVEVRASLEAYGLTEADIVASESTECRISDVEGAVEAIEAEVDLVRDAMRSCQKRLDAIDSGKNVTTEIRVAELEGRTDLISAELTILRNAMTSWQNTLNGVIDEFGHRAAKHDVGLVEVLQQMSDLWRELGSVRQAIRQRAVDIGVESGDDCRQEQPQGYGEEIEDGP